jgi:translation initiation factor 6 (eIF-6)
LTAFGVNGNLVRANDKMARLKTLLWDKAEQKVDDEKVLDTCYDLINYGVYMAMMLSGKWE